ncbi:MAG: RNA polymerase sigma factor SigJ [Chloroflexota bacterium]|nr:RNA polymerase sigma factor SigJ [Chloroflexota bacterium]
MVRQFIPYSPATDVALGGIWREHHRFLINVAYRMLGTVSEAEDVVQDAFARLLRVDLAEIKDVRGWLVVAVSRLCLDQLRSARARREVYVGPWLPEPVIQAPDPSADPAERITLDDSVRMAILVVLERLSPAERVAFVLHDVFQFSFDEVAAIVHRTPAACRQLASRARRRVQTEASPARFDVDPDILTRVANRFITAASNGDLNALVQVLDPNVVDRVDSGGVVAAPRRPRVGHRHVAQRFLQFVQAFRITLVPMPINGEPGALAYQDDRLKAVIALSIRDGLIDQIFGIVSPTKLAYVASLLDGQTVPPTATGPVSGSAGSSKLP